LYDMDLYDRFAYDYGVKPNNGFDSFFYDFTRYDYSDTVRSPRKLSIKYPFTVRATDGVSYTDRLFRIYVVGDDHFRADNTLMDVGTNTFTADITFLRKPIWTTPSYLGKRRANNYITLSLDVYDAATLQGRISYVLNSVNEEVIITNASWKGSNNLIDSIDITVDPSNVIGDIKLGYYINATGIPHDAIITAWDPETKKLTVSWNVAKAINGFDTQRITVGTPSVLPPGLFLDEISGKIYGSVPYQPAVTRNYKFTVIAVRYTFDNDLILASSSRTFNIDLIGEIDSTIRFVTNGDLGSIDANFISNLSVKATTTIKNSVLSYTLIGGKLPPGLILVSDGTLQGKVNQYSSIPEFTKFDSDKTTFDNSITTMDKFGYAIPKELGLTTFDNNETYFDNFTTSVDREYRFVILAQDQFNLSSTSKVFNLKVATPNNLLYSNIYVKPFLRQDKRFELTGFFNDPTIFTRSMIYRPNDPEFGIQATLKMLLYPGIETKTAAQYVSIFGRSSKKKFRFGSLKKAVAKTPATNDVVYEVIYLEVLDNLETDKGSVSSNIDITNRKHPITVNQGRRDIIDSDLSYSNIYLMSQDVLPRIMLQDKTITADFSGQLINSSNKSSVFGNSVTNIRKNISNLGETERNFLPLWMRTAQTRSGVDQGFTKAVVLCYCNPGSADYIMQNIYNSGFDFNSIDFTVDRAIIDSVKGESGDKYIAFPAREVING
jgi:hypothetical protein